MMRPDHIRSVQATWLRVLPVKDATARLFYERLFEMDPSLKRMFRSDMDQQGEKLMQVIDAAINGLALFEQIRSSIQELGRRHANYGVKDHHYGTVGAALLWALGKSLGPEFTPQVRHAWVTVTACSRRPCGRRPRPRRMTRPGRCAWSRRRPRQDPTRGTRRDDATP